MFVISYDPVSVLSGFASEHGVTYDMLSDEGSRVIAELGLLNQHVEAQQTFFGRGVSERHQGIPYPGTFVLDEQGVVAARHFEQSYRDRPSGSYLLDGVGLRAATPGAEAHAEAGGVAVHASLDVDRYRPLQIVPVRVRLDIPADVHVYVPPVPEGFVPLAVEVRDHEMLQSWPATLPQGRPFSVEGLDESFHVVDGAVELTVPIKPSGRAFELDGRPRATPLESGDVTVPIVLRYQACTSRDCFPPQEVRLELHAAEEDLLRPER